MKNEKKLCEFSYYKNIANLEAFWRDKIFRKNLLFLGKVNPFTQILVPGVLELHGLELHDFEQHGFLERFKEFEQCNFLL